MNDRITIVGGGLAGLTLGIALRRRHVPVEIWEAGKYPRHRVCGEFISGAGQATLKRLGLLAALPEDATRLARTAAFFDEARPVLPARRLPEAALCISRHVLDAELARVFQSLGGTLREGQRWVSSFDAGVVRATGRRPETHPDGWRWFGLKVHASGVELDADLEMHFGSDGYVGLCRLPRNEINICGLFRSREPVPDLGRHWRNWLGGGPGSVLHGRLANATFDDRSFCSIAGISLVSHRAIDLEECCVGDALSMIAPVTGNGMSMAFESAELAAEALARFAGGEVPWAATKTAVARACDARFNVRLRWAARMQSALFQPAARRTLLWLGRRSEWIWRELIRLTR